VSIPTGKKSARISVISKYETHLTERLEICQKCEIKLKLKSNQANFWYLHISVANISGPSELNSTSITHSVLFIVASSLSAESGCFSAKLLGKHCFIKYKSDLLLWNLNPQRICPQHYIKMKPRNTPLLLPKEMGKNLNENDHLGVSSVRFHLNNVPHLLCSLQCDGLHIAKPKKSTFYEEIKMLWAVLDGGSFAQRMVSINHSQDLLPCGHQIPSEILKQ
jgi:hypothetical protein